MTIMYVPPAIRLLADSRVNPFAGLHVLRVIPSFSCGADGGECDRSVAVSGQIRCARYRGIRSDTSKNADIHALRVDEGDNPQPPKH
jgi:hypothetical protein